MPSFEELLKASLQGAGAQLDVADADLNREVANAAEAIQRITEGKMSLALDKTWVDERGIIYSLLLGTPSSTREILAFWLKPEGYPLVVGPEMRDLRRELRQDTWRTLKDRNDLSSFFSELASDSGSPLVVAIAWLLRRAQKPETTSGQMASDVSAKPLRASEENGHKNIQ